MINREAAALPLRRLRNQYGLHIRGQELAHETGRSIEKISRSPRAGYVSDIKNIGTHVFDHMYDKNGPGESNNFAKESGGAWP